MSSATKGVLIGCGSLLLIGVLCVAGIKNVLMDAWKKKGGVPAEAGGM